MANFEPKDRIAIENYLQMGGGYVLNFNNRTFSNFISDSTGKDIDDYGRYGEGSKANRLRKFFKVEDGQVVGKLLTDFVAHRQETDQNLTPEIIELANKVLAVASRINPPILGGHNSIDALKPLSNDTDGTLLFEEIRLSIGRNEHSAALDRLHTWMVHYIRNLLSKNGIEWNDGQTLDAIFNKLSKFYRDNDYCESSMSATILKGIGKNLTEFNHVRNNQSFAHANTLLSKSEARFICNTTFDTVKFINGIQEKVDAEKRRVEIDAQRKSNLPF
ncbi:MAG: abortive infection family protein [Bacteroidetes bacterium]|jgi:hypothetical protein|nr:abortive infection family protein [Bacteroidota bacterium]